MEIEIPCVLMRGGTSRGPFFLADDLPEDIALRDELLLDVMGSPHELQINGIGGGSTLTSKVAIISRSALPDCDVDYLFAQVSVMKRTVDTRPNCGNMLAAVGPYAIEQGLVPVQGKETIVRIRNINTGTRVEAIIQTPNGAVSYEGDTRIDGVPGTGAPIVLCFEQAEGSLTGKLFPTGQRTDWIDGVAVSCVDVAMPVMVVHAEDLGKTGRESAAELDQDKAFLARLESLRLQAGRLMGMGDVSQSVVPKPVVVSAAEGGTIRSRYFTPHSCHKAHAVTGAIAVASSAMLPGTVSHSLMQTNVESENAVINVAHPSGQIAVSLEVRDAINNPKVVRAGVVRTARRIMKGSVCVPAPVSIVA